MSSFEEKTLAKETIYNGRIIDLEVHTVSLPNGKESTRELVFHPGAVAVLAITDDDKIVTVRQYRKALKKEVVEIPAGKLEPNEDPLLCAKRELEEETGIIASTWSKLHSFYTSPGFADELVHVYLAEDLQEGSVNLDEDEFVSREDYTLDESKSLIDSLDIHDAKTIYAILMWELRKLKGQA
ncbi:NUDIX hydrolase [Paenalkalicoccus suaedae]|uniref:NUDIX hydrolase n=1 Tax=Paenalkalicoccus suaedae TaxID=2592382 RepID=A0A859FCQ7_9BACI|nr:NUDIX hydrolase [Paenalkalicoccus suaedae]QKS71019.1 NUDIX hydrolase [Paenalkalicoccus suaedae]